MKIRNLSTISVFPNRKVSHKLSTYEIGKSFENETIRCLKRFGFVLRRVGGSDDKGIDLRGKIHIQSKDFCINSPIIVQCKDEKSKIGPKYLRELVGTLQHETIGTIGILASSNGFSKKVFHSVHSQKVPLLLAQINMGVCNKFVLNSAAQDSLPGLICLGDDVVQLYFHHTLL